MNFAKGLLEEINFLGSNLLLLDMLNDCLGNLSLIGLSLTNLSSESSFSSWLVSISDTYLLIALRPYSL